MPLSFALLGAVVALRVLLVTPLHSGIQEPVGMHGSKGFPNHILGFDDVAGLVSVRRQSFFEERTVRPRFDGQLFSFEKVMVTPACFLLQIFGELIEMTLDSHFLKIVKQLERHRAVFSVRAQPDATRHGQLQNQVVFAIPGGICIIRWSTNFK